MVVALGEESLLSSTINSQKLVKEIVETLQEARVILDEGGTVEEFDEQMVEDVKNLDFSKLTASLIKSEDGFLALELF